MPARSPPWTPRIVFPYAQNAVLIGFVSASSAVSSAWRCCYGSARPSAGCWYCPVWCRTSSPGSSQGVRQRHRRPSGAAVAGGFVNGLPITLPACPLLVRVLAPSVRTPPSATPTSVAGSGRQCRQTRHRRAGDHHADRRPLGLAIAVQRKRSTPSPDTDRDPAGSYPTAPPAQHGRSTRLLTRALLAFCRRGRTQALEGGLNDRRG